VTWSALDVENLALTAALPSLTKARGLRAVVDNGLLKPRVLKCLLGGDAILRIIDKYLLKEVKELFVEIIVGRNEFLQLVSMAFVIGKNQHSHGVVSSPLRTCETLVSSPRSDSQVCFG
jgi:hypothetical protein